MVETPYDFLMIVWGLVFIVAWIAFIAVMNRIFKNEEREWVARDRATETSSAVDQHHPVHPAA